MIDFRESQVFVGELAQFLQGRGNRDYATSYGFEKFSCFAFVHIGKIIDIIAQGSKGESGFLGTLETAGDWPWILSLCLGKRCKPPHPSEWAGR